MHLHDVTVRPSKAKLPREERLAWKIAAVAADKIAVPTQTEEMIVNRVIDNAAVGSPASSGTPACRRPTWRWRTRRVPAGRVLPSSAWRTARG